MVQNEMKGKKGQGQNPGSSHYLPVWQKLEEQLHTLKRGEESSVV